jgi:hypothetical protein
MTKQTKSVLNNNLDFIQLKLYDFSDEKIDQEKIISGKLNKNPKIENTNNKLFLDENYSWHVKSKPPKIWWVTYQKQPKTISIF